MVKLSDQMNGKTKKAVSAPEMKQTGNNRMLDGTFALGNDLSPSRWKPGQCPNPNGRKGALRDIFNEAFSKQDTPEGKSAQQDAIEKLKGACRKGNLKAIRMWLEWSLSKPPQEINVGPSESLIEYEQKKATVVAELLGSIPKKTGDGGGI